jgi:2,3-bisphosphoglycerate-independent phosphoglycerate mutase
LAESFWVENMKYVVLLGDGMSDYPLAEKGAKTPLQLSNTPFMDSLAQTGALGLVKTIPDGMPPGSDVANLSVMGYDPARYYSGRAPIEAASIGVKLGEHDIAFRCNLVTLAGDAEQVYMEDYSAGHIPTDDAQVILSALKQELDLDDITFYRGVSYRHLVVWKNGTDKMITTPPHDITGKNISSYLPQGDGSERLLDLMEKARKIIPALPISQQKIQQGKKFANAIWLWGQGRSLSIPTFREKYGLTGAVISAVDLVKGLGICAGLTSIDVPGATGYLDTNYEGKARAALDALHSVDFVYLHVEAPDEAGHKGNIDEKIQAIEDFDRRVVKLVVEGLRDKYADYRVLVLPDHPTPIALKTHASDPVPFVLFSSKDLNRTALQSVGFNEKDAAASGLFIESGWELMDRFIKN